MNNKEKYILFKDNKKRFEFFLSKMRKTKSNDFDKLIRKISPFIKTQKIGDYLSLRFKYSDNTILLKKEDTQDYFPFIQNRTTYEITSSLHKPYTFTIHVDSHYELLSKLTYTYNFFFLPND